MPPKTQSDKGLPKWKKVLAGVGLLYATAFAVWAIHALIERAEPVGATELASHPERQDETLAERKARELQEQLSLSEEQTAEVADILYAYRKQQQMQNGTVEGDPFGRMQARMAVAQVVREEIEALLSQEQRDAFAGIRTPWTPPIPRMGPMPGMRRGDRGGPGGFQGPPERMRKMMEAQGVDPDQFQNMDPEERRQFMMKMMQERGMGPRGGLPGPLRNGAPPPVFTENTEDGQ